MQWEVDLNSMYKGSEINLDLRLFGPSSCNVICRWCMNWCNDVCENTWLPKQWHLKCSRNKDFFPKNLLKAELINQHEMRLSRLQKELGSKLAHTLPSLETGAHLHLKHLLRLIQAHMQLLPAEYYSVWNSFTLFVASMIYVKSSTRSHKTLKYQ